MRKDEFLNYVQVGNESECWLWLGADNGRNYGRLFYDNRYQQAHRVSYQIFCGDISHNTNVLHTCDNTFCVNPKHIFLGTQQDNVDDCIAKGRFNAGSNPQRGEYSANALLTDDKVREIKKLIDEGYKHKDIAEWFGVARQTITNINTGKRWSHVT